MRNKDLYSIPDIASIARLDKRLVYEYLSNHSRLDQCVRKSGRMRYFTKEFCDEIVSEMSPPDGWTKMKDLSDELGVDPVVMYTYVMSHSDGNDWKMVRHCVYLSPEYVERITRHNDDRKSRSQQWRQTRQGRKYYAQKERETDDWLNSPVDESELVMFDGFLLTPSQHVTRLEIRNRVYKDVPGFVIDHFRRLVRDNPAPAVERPPIDDSALAADYLSGMSLGQLATRFQRTRMAIVYRLKKAGVYGKRTQPPPKPVQFHCRGAENLS